MSLPAASAGAASPAEAEGVPVGAGELGEVVTRRITLALLVAHGVGALDVFALLWWVLPLPVHHDYPGAATANVVAFVVGFPIAGVLGAVWGRRRVRRRREWLREGRPPTDSERRAVLREPLAATALNAAFWAAGAMLFAAINAPSSLTLAGHVGTTILLGGLTTCAIGYLLVERLMRPVTALALSSGRAPELTGPGVKGRLVLAWLFASGVPLLGLVLLALHVLAGGVSAERAGAGMLALGLAALLVGLVAALVSARSVADPLGAVRDALARVEAGDLSVEVAVDDSSEIGLLQSGFNRMAAGLRERERMRDLFGRHVGQDVARAALEHGGVSLGGEARDVAVIFVDLVGSTALAAQEPPERVVALLNQFFGVVVAVTHAHGGWVNKFEGDGALCVFGAPVALPDPARAALPAGRELHRRLLRELPQLRAALGLSAGLAVAGNVGAEERFEYTVIGDPVNEAARLCDLAKGSPHRLIASEAILARANQAERRYWHIGDSTVLRGRTTATRLATPA